MPQQIPATNPVGHVADSGLKAAIFDVDGTLVDSERDGHRVAFNRAFEELGLPDRWDVAAYGRLLAITGGERRLHAHLEGRGMALAERSDLVPRLHARKTALFRDMAAAGQIAARPGSERLLADLERAGVRLAVATTGTRAWVGTLLDRVFGTGRFEVVVTGDEAPERKPDPSAYVLALERLGLSAAVAVAIEDSENGLVAAQGAELPCAIVLNDYTRGQAMTGADLVLDGFGDVGGPVAVLSDPHGVAPPGCLDAMTLARLRTTVPPNGRQG